MLQNSAERNSHLFRLYYYLDHKRSDLRTDESEDHVEDIHRLEFKLDYLIDLVSSLIKIGDSLPEETPVVLTTETLRWRREASDLAPGDWLQLNLYLPGIYTRPVEFYGQLIETKAVESTHECQMTICSSQEKGADWLDRLIFREHRREIARLKHS